MQGWQVVKDTLGCITAFRSATPYGLDDNLPVTATRKKQVVENPEDQPFNLKEIEQTKAHKIMEQKRQQQARNDEKKAEEKDLRDIQNGKMEERISNDIRCIQTAKSKLEATIQQRKIDLQKAERAALDLRKKYREKQTKILTIEIKQKIKDIKRTESLLQKDYASMGMLDDRLSALSQAQNTVIVTAGVSGGTAFSSEMFKKIANKLDDYSQIQEEFNVEFGMVANTVENANMSFQMEHGDLEKEFEDFMNEVPEEEIHYDMDMTTTEPVSVQAHSDPNKMTEAEEALFNGAPEVPTDNPEVSLLDELVVVDDDFVEPVTVKKPQKKTTEYAQ